MEERGGGGRTSGSGAALQKLPLVNFSDTSRLKFTNIVHPDAKGSIGPTWCPRHYLAGPTISYAKERETAEQSMCRSLSLSLSFTHRHLVCELQKGWRVVGGGKREGGKEAPTMGPPSFLHPLPACLHARAFFALPLAADRPQRFPMLSFIPGVCVVDRGFTFFLEDVPAI